MVGFSQEFSCSQVKPLVPRETLYPQLLYDSSNAQPPENIKTGKMRHVHREIVPPPPKKERALIYQVELHLFSVHWISEGEVALGAYALCMIALQFHLGKTDAVISKPQLGQEGR